MSNNDRTLTPTKPDHAKHGAARSQYKQKSSRLGETKCNPTPTQQLRRCDVGFHVSTQPTGDRTSM